MEPELRGSRQGLDEAQRDGAQGRLRMPRHLPHVCSVPGCADGVVLLLVPQRDLEVVGVKGVAGLDQDLLVELQGPREVHVVADALGLAAVHGGVAAEPGLKLTAGQEVDPEHLISIEGKCLGFRV